MIPNKVDGEFGYSIPGTTEVQNLHTFPSREGVELSDRKPLDSPLPHYIEGVLIGRVGTS